MRKAKEIRKSGALLIFPSGGLNDIFNQIYAAEKVAKSKNLTAFVSLEHGTRYEAELNHIVNGRSEILNMSDYPGKDRQPSISDLQNMLSSKDYNQAIRISSTDFAFFGSGGGIRGSARFLLQHGPSEEILRELAHAESKSNLDLAAIHVRCSDMKPDSRIIRRYARKREHFIAYSDCELQKILPENKFTAGYSPSQENTRSGSDLVSLILMSRHKSLFLVPLNNASENKKIKFSGFGLLALVLHLKHHGIFSASLGGTRHSLGVLLIRDPKMFLAVILESIRPNSLSF